MRYDSLQAWLQWLETCHPQEIDLGLERVNKVAQSLELSFTGAKVVTVAGTNGKGSCVALLSSLLTAAGYRTAAYTSPHLLNYNERIVIAGEAVDDGEIVAAFDRIDRARQSTSLTYFEFGTLAALDIFNRHELDVIILEVGLGGRLDAVNIIDPDVAVISSIAIDHQDWLGDDREKIGWEKAGIIRRDKPLVCGDLDPPESIGRAVIEAGARLYQRDEHFHVLGLPNKRWQWQGQGQGLDADSCRLDNLPQPVLSIDNVATALQAIELLGLPIDSSVFQTLPSIKLPGRFEQRVHRGHQLVLDVAHNPAAARNLASCLQHTGGPGRTFALLAMMGDKDCDGLVGALESSVDAWYVVDLKDISRAMAAVELAAYIHRQTDLEPAIYPGPEEGLNAALAAMTDLDRLVVTGSFLLVADVMKLINSGVSLNE
jgi:dihydrofolate synthase/folylpolyglutamate synthase